MKRKRFVKGLYVGLLVLFLCFVSLHCGDEFDANVVPGQGNLSINGGPATSFFITNVTIVNAGNTSTITLNNAVSTTFGLFDVMTINLVVPNGQVGVNIDLSTTTSNMVETTTNSSGGVVSTDFTSTGVTGNINLQFLTSVSGAGTYNATFTDATGNTRVITNGSFVLNF